jgi:hypothetical protein
MITIPAAAVTPVSIAVATTLITFTARGGIITPTRLRRRRHPLVAALLFRHRFRLPGNGAIPSAVASTLRMFAAPVAALLLRRGLFAGDKSHQLPQESKSHLLSS